MWRDNEILEKIVDCLQEIDGYVSDKPDQNDNYEWYEADIEIPKTEPLTPNIINLQITSHLSDKKDIDKFKIVIERIQ